MLFLLLMERMLRVVPAVLTQQVAAVRRDKRLIFSTTFNELFQFAL